MSPTDNEPKSSRLSSNQRFVALLIHLFEMNPSIFSASGMPTVTACSAGGDGSLSERSPSASKTNSSGDNTTEITKNKGSDFLIDLQSFRRSRSICGKIIRSPASVKYGLPNIRAVV